MNIPDITIDYEPVPASADRSSRRRYEQQAVMSLIRKRFGKDAILQHDVHGAPSVEGSTGYISISHCQGLAVLAAHPGLRIGIDMEIPRIQLERIRHKYLTQDEMAAFITPDDLLWAWTAKEAVYKAAGIAGLPLNSIALESDRHVANVMTDGTTNTIRFKLYSAFSNNLMVTVAVPL